MAAMRLVLAALAALGCVPDKGPADAGAQDVGSVAEDASVDDAAITEDAAATDASANLPPNSVRVLLDGVPEEAVRVVQGGTPLEWRTGPDGIAEVDPDLSVIGEIVLIASHPDARIRGAYLDDDGSATIELVRFDRSDNPEYAFQDPGEPTRRPSTTQCAHCHQTINEDWFASPHRTSASNPQLLALYSEAKQVDPAGFGGCADCHAPGMTGVLSGRDLDEATGFAADYGVHCDVCHRVEAVDELGAPAFGGWLRAIRPTEEGHPTLGAGGLLPITFGPSHDSPNPRMGSVQRNHFRQARFCGGCHQLEQPGLAGTVDSTRWPSGRLPIHTTYAEWKDGLLADVAACQDCHMPPAADVANGGDLQRFELAMVGIPGGWYRPPGSVRRHSFVGPRTPSSGMLELAGAIIIDKSVQGGIVAANVTVTNAGAGHALPTGEPMRSIILTVDADCAGTPLVATGGHAVPSFGGYVERKTADFGTWPNAQIGDVVRVVSVGPPVDYVGFGPFGDGTFDAAAKNLLREDVVGEATVVSTSPVTFDRPIPQGDAAYLVRSDASAGRPGFAFARVLTDAGGNEMVPHHEATDVAVDNRLMPQARFTTTHSFQTTCPDPVITARLIWRRFPLSEARARGWDPGDRVMTEVRR